MSSGVQLLKRGLSIVTLALTVPAFGETLIDIDFNSGVDSFGNSAGDLVFQGAGQFEVAFTDDASNGSSDADGVHISNLNNGNIKVGSETDLVLGAQNEFFNGGEGGGFVNRHTSGIVAHFNQGVELVMFQDTDNDGTTKTLFAFDENGVLIGSDGPDTQRAFRVDTTITSGQLIHSIEFDTQAGTAGGSFDGTFFTLDDFHVEGTAIPEPTTAGVIIVALALGAGVRRRKCRVSI